MQSGSADPSLEPLLRARASGAYSIPSSNLRTLGGGPRSRTAQVNVKEARSGREDFVEFLHSLGRAAISPYVSYIALSFAR